MNSYNLGAGAAATDIIYPQEHHPQQHHPQQHPNASELLREYVDKVGAQQELQRQDQQQQPATGEFPTAVNKTANFSVSHLLDLEELPRENCAMFATPTALDGNAGGGMTTDGVALRLQRPSDANSPMDSACCGLPGNAGAIGSRSPDEAKTTPHKQHSGKSRRIHVTFIESRGVVLSEKMAAVAGCFIFKSWSRQ